MRVPTRPVGILLRLQVNLEDGRQYQRRRRLRHPVSETRYAQRPELPTLQVPRQCPQPPVHPLRLDVRDRLAVHPGCAAVATDGLEQLREDQSDLANWTRGRPEGPLRADGRAARRAEPIRRAVSEQDEVSSTRCARRAVCCG